VPESMVADLTARYEALKVDQTTLSEAIPLIQAGKGIVQIATQLGMPVSCE
jgi:F420-0:gamma-glutamyl ligase-like protein